MLYILI